MKISDYLTEKSAKTNFPIQNLERQFNVIKILSSIFRDPYLKKNLALRGGTAIQGVWGQMARLSYDLDLDFVGGISKQKMKSKRIKLLDYLKSLGDKMGYQIIDKPAMSNYIMNRIFFKFAPTSSFQQANWKVKLELSFLNRVPFTNLIERPFFNLFDDKITNFSIPTYSPNEFLAMKAMTILTRNKSRDLFDFYTLMVSDQVDLNILKKLMILNLCTVPKIELKGFFDISNFKNFISISKERIEVLPLNVIKHDLINYLPKGFKINFETFKDQIIDFYSSIPPINEREQIFWHKFFHGNDFNPDLIIEDLEVFNKNLSEHPAIKLRILKESGWKTRKNRKKYKTK